MKSSNNASARSWQLEFFNGEREGVVFWVVDQEAMENIFLDAFGLVAGRDQGAGGSHDHVAFFNSSGLRVLDAVRLDAVDDGAPLAVDIDGPERTDVIGGTWAEIRFVVQLVQSVDRVVSVGHFVLVESQDGLVVLVQGLLHFMLGIFRVFQAPGLGRVFGAVRNLDVLVLWLSTVNRWSVVRVWRAENSDRQKSKNLKEELAHLVENCFLCI